MSASEVHINSLTVHSDIQFIKLLRFIKEHPGCSRHDVLAAVRGPECDRPGFYSSYFAYMFGNDYAQMKRDGKHFKYYITSRGEVLLLCAEANGPMPKRTKHTAVVKGAFIPFNPEIPKERKNLETTVKLINEMLKRGAYWPAEENLDKPVQKEEIFEILKSITGTQVGLKPLFNRLSEYRIITEEWQRDRDGIGYFKNPGFYVSERALKIAGVWPLVEVSAQM